ncbi:hypothetical protein ACNVED_04210 [Legionella sp. D16C41]|uniref:hypothetical protein n=1 Tax=Legionella sp. D16C41 TaxID=3402688 RepID=UPI003AF97EE8
MKYQEFKDWLERLRDENSTKPHILKLILPIFEELDKISPNNPPGLTTCNTLKDLLYKLAYHGQNCELSQQEIVYPGMRGLTVYAVFNSDQGRAEFINSITEEPEFNKGMKKAEIIVKLENYIKNFKEEVANARSKPEKYYKGFWGRVTGMNAKVKIDAAQTFLDILEGKKEPSALTPIMFQALKEGKLGDIVKCCEENNLFSWKDFTATPNSIIEMLDNQRPIPIERPGTKLQ